MSPSSLLSRGVAVSSIVDSTTPSSPECFARQQCLTNLRMTLSTFLQSFCLTSFDLLRLQIHHRVKTWQCFGWRLAIILLRRWPVWPRWPWKGFIPRDLSFACMSHFSFWTYGDDLQTFRRIFNGPKSVTSGKPGPASKRKSVAQIIGMTHVTARTIAYVAVQVWTISMSLSLMWQQTFTFRHD